MKRFLFVIIFALSLQSNAAGINDEVDESLLEKIRLVYYSGVEDDSYIDTLKYLIDNNFDNDADTQTAIAVAYRAGIFALKSKHAFWPVTKMNYLADSMDLFENALKSEPDNLEIRFMRYSILYYVPGILGYSDLENEDLQKVYELLVQKDYTSINREIQSGMIEFILKTDMLTAEQEQLLENELMLAGRNE